MHTEFLPLAQWSDRYWPMLVVGLIGLYLVRPFFLWPLSIFSVFIGYAFGFPVGVPLALLGTLLTCAPPFLIATWFNEGIPYFGRIVEHGTTLVETTGELRGMVAARLSPVPADAVSYGAGLAGVTTQAFVVGTLIGELPWAIFYVLLGRSLRTFSAAAIRHTDSRLILVVAVISLLLIARPLYEFVQEHTGRDEKTSTDHSG
ncbi:TVP38/TMEM64 family protein [Halocatena pleomorpha]|nr:VTT domain-containing protein [Halocatena pleomorpha]